MDRIFIYINYPPQKIIDLVPFNEGNKSDCYAFLRVLFKIFK